MERAESYAALAPLLSAQLRRGVVTNCFLSAEEFRREIESGLFFEAGDGFLLLFRQRPEHLLLHFYLQPGASLHLPALNLPVVTELACREKDRAAMQRAEAALCVRGFAPVFHRLRRTRDAGLPLPGAESPCSFPLEDVRAFLLSQFDPLTGCIPTDADLRQALSSGEILCLADAHGICGLLHYAPGRTACEIRHLAVRADCRQAGLAQRLLAMLTARTDAQRCIVWARQGNLPAEHFYEKNHFQPDGWVSTVLRLSERNLHL